MLGADDRVVGVDQKRRLPGVVAAVACIPINSRPRRIVDAVQPGHVEDRRIELIALPADRAHHLLGTGEQQIAVHLVDPDALADVVDRPQRRHAIRATRSGSAGRGARDRLRHS